MSPAHLPVSRNVGRFRVVAAVIHAAVNVEVQTPFQILVSAIWVKSRSGIAGSLTVLCSNNELTRKLTMPFTITSKTRKYLGMNLNRKGKTLH